MPGIVRALETEVSFNGSAVANALMFNWSYGYDTAVSEATFSVPTVLTGGSYFDDVTITVDGDVRFSGLLVQRDFSGYYPRGIAYQARGRLELARRYKLPEAIAKEEGLALADLMGGTSPTDQNIVIAVLAYIGLSTNGGVIGGTGTVLGTIAPEEFVWKGSESALDYIQRIDAISLGYRTFETAGGQIYRSQITSRPAGTPDFTLTEGVDIMTGSASRTVQEAFNAVRVGGYAVGDYADPRVFYIAEANFAWESGPRVFEWNNSMIERRADVSPGLGFSCEAECNYWLGELNREIVRVNGLTTPRMDVFGPGQVHLVQAAGGLPDRLGVGEKLWLQRVDGQLEQSGALNHRLAYVGGGADL